MNSAIPSAVTGATVVRAWHFLPDDRRLRYGDGRRVRTGCWHSVRFPYTSETGEVYPRPVLCEAGMHASVRPLDALEYAPGATVGLCEVRGVEGVTLLRGSDKVVGEARRYLAIADVTDALHLFACDEAERALDAREATGDAVDPRSRAAIEAKRGFVVGTVSSRELAAAWDTARDAARDAAWDAANSRLETVLLGALGLSGVASTQSS